jgi:hypothetical protein
VHLEVAEALASRPKVSFDQMAAPVPEIMDYDLFTAAVALTLCDRNLYLLS